MSSQLVNCPKCRRHFFAEKGSCPFCARPMDNRFARMAMAAMTPMVLGACYGGPKMDSGETGLFNPPDTGTGVGGPADGTGSYVLTIEGSCSIGWDVAGAYVGSGTDYRWDASLSVNAGLTDCPGGENTSGLLVAEGGQATFDGNYIGMTTYGTNSVSWETTGYVAGDGGGQYAYDGTISW
ncbi:MAG TPA: hypothetical protein DFR83_02270 [Deltaproteobacteria bacterium]|nr:hypothetical protein [Deltaproteobacteria bacterium]